MKLYDELIREMNALLAPLQGKRTEYDPALAWPGDEKSRLVLMRDAACELGDGPRSIGTFLAESAEPGRASAVELYGPDIPDIKGSTPYARITIANIAGDEASDDALYLQLRSVDFAKFAVYPQGFMTRFSAQAHQEQVRVSLEAAKAGISFAQVGMCYIKGYLSVSQASSIRQIYVTDPAADYAALARITKRADEITAALNHILAGMPTDCSQCKLKEICDEVDGMKAAHFQSESKRKK